MDGSKVTPNEWLSSQLEQLATLRAMKYNASTSDEARSYAVTITEMEKVIAYFGMYVAAGSIPVETGTLPK